MHKLLFSWYESAGEERNNAVPYGCVAGSLRREDCNMASIVGLLFAELRMEDVNSFFNFLRMQLYWSNVLTERFSILYKNQIKEDTRFYCKSMEWVMKII